MAAFVLPGIDLDSSSIAVKTIPLVALCLLFAGCSAKSSDRARLALLEEENKRLVDEMIGLRQDVGQMKSDIKKDEEAVLFLLAKMNQPEGTKPALLSSTTKGFELAKTEYGSFLISLIDVQPYLNGYRVTLSIGNPLEADVTDGTITVKFGASQENLTTISQPIDQPIVGGRWTDMSVTVAPARADQLGYLGVTLEPTGVQLHQDQVQ